MYISQIIDYCVYIHIQYMWLCFCVIVCTCLYAFGLWAMLLPICLCAQLVSNSYQFILVLSARCPSL
jgi:uncharacterized membrane protein